MTLLHIPIVRAKGVMEIDTDLLMEDKFPANSLLEIIYQGLKQVLNRGQAVSPTMETAYQRWNECHDESLRIHHIPRPMDYAIRAEAMRLARTAIKDQLKSTGHKLSHIPAKNITTAAIALLNGKGGKAFMDKAKETIKAQTKR